MKIKSKYWFSQQHLPQSWEIISKQKKIHEWFTYYYNKELRIDDKNISDK